MKYFALYKADEILFVGTKQELANYLKVKLRTIDFYKSKTYRKRSKDRSYIVIEVKE